MRTADHAVAVASSSALEPREARRALGAAFEVVPERLAAGGEVALTGAGTRPKAAVRA